MPWMKLKLGSVTFANSEIAQKITFGGEQRLAVHKLVGGGKVVDAMGRDDISPSWSGIFLGSNAITRARYLDSLRISGTPLKLSWSEFSYQVVVSLFHADFELQYKIPYQITCEVVADLTKPVNSSKPTSLLGKLQEGLDAIMGVIDMINDNPLTQAIGQVQAVLKNIPTATFLSSSVSLPLIAPLYTAQVRTDALTTSTNATIQANPQASTASALNAQITAVQMLYNLLLIAGILRTMLANIQSMTNGGTIKTISIAGGNLLDIANQQYGDATLWLNIALANGLYDPMIATPMTLVIPNIPNSQRQPT